MASRSASKTRKCASCGARKPLLDFPTTDADECLACTVQKAAPASSEALPEPLASPEPVGSGDLFQHVDAEIDPASPTIQEMAARTLARRRLLPFIRRFRPKYQAGWVHEDICRRLERFVEAVERQEEPRLLLCMPVRMGKSEIGSRHFPAWVLGRHPDWEIIAASGASNLAMSFSRYLRDLLRDDSYQAVFPRCQLDPASQSVENWSTTAGGGYLAAGIGTMITGRGAHCVVPYCAVNTPSGMIPISKLKVGGVVYGYDHEAGRVVETKITAVSASARRTRLVKVKGGPTITEEHKIYDASTLTYKDARLSNGVPGMWFAESSTRSDVLGVLLEGQDFKEHRAALRLLREEVSKARIGAPEKSGSGREKRSRVLWERLLSRVQAKKPRKLQQGERRVPQLFEAGYWVQSTKILFSLVLRGLSGSATLLGRIWRGIPCSEGVGVQTRQGLSALWAGKIAEGSTSYRRGREQQRCEEPDNFVSAVSQKVSSLYGTSAQHLAELLPDEDYVVDIQTGTGNFFAAGLLVHNCLLIDDAVKDAEAADSQTIRDNVWEWYISTALSRLAPGGGVLCIMTHWHDDDLAGRLQQLSQVEGADTFEVVKYPAINDLGDEYILSDDSIVQLPPGSDVPEGAKLTRKQNTALHAERYTLESLLKRKATYYAQGQQRWWAALYQQNPAPEEGAYFTKKMFRYYANKPHKLERNVYQAWDFAITEKQQADYIVGATGELDVNDNLHIVDIDRFRSGDSFVIADAMLDAWERHGSEAVIGVEDGQIWRSIEAVFVRRCQERKLYPSIEVMKPFTDKLVRAQPLRGRMQLGKVWFPDNAPWMDVLRQEFLRFPTGKHDDIIDSCSWLTRLVLSRQAPRLKKPKEQRSWKDRLKGIMNGTKGASHMAA